MLTVPVLILRGGGADQNVPTVILALRRHRLQNWLNKVGLVLRRFDPETLALHTELAVIQASLLVGWDLLQRLGLDHSASTILRGTDNNPSISLPLALRHDSLDLSFISCLHAYTLQVLKSLCASLAFCY